MTLFEKAGRFFFEKNRAIIFFVFLLTPFAISSLFLFSRFMKLRECEEAIERTSLQARSAIEKREKRARFFERYAKCEPYFINQHLETLPLLQKELRQLLQMKHHPGCSEQPSVSQRIAFLVGAQNRMRFAEENVRSSEKVKETEEKLQHTVEIDIDDLNNILSLIENMPIGSFSPDLASPQILIQDFLLSKKDPTVYKLNLALLKREFTISNESKN